MTRNNGKWKEYLTDSLIALGAFCVATGICFLLDYFQINTLNFIIIYILGILLTAVLTKGYVYSVVLSVISVFGYNFFFHCSALYAAFQ